MTEPSALPREISPYVVCVSQLLPFRNIPELIAGFREACAGGFPEWSLAIVGGSTLPHYFERLSKLGGRIRGRGDVVFVGPVKHEAVRGWIERAEIFAFPSTCENCPTSLIEAMSVGAAVAASNVPPMPEIAGSAAIYFDPWSPSDIAAALTRLMADEAFRKQLRHLALTEVERFPQPPEVAARTLEVIVEAAREERGGK